MSYSPRFHSIRRVIHKELTGRALQKYWPVYEQESRTLIKRSLANPAGLLRSIHQCVTRSFVGLKSIALIYLIHSYSGSVILKVIYGYQTETQDDPFLDLGEKVVAIFSQVSQPGAWLVETIPWRTSRFRKTTTD